MSEKTNKEVANVELYKQYEVQNLDSLEMCVEYLNKYIPDADLSSEEFMDVCITSYEKDTDNTDEVIEYVSMGEELNPRAIYWIKKSIKYNGLSNWAKWMQEKFISEGE